MTRRETRLAAVILALLAIGVALLGGGMHLDRDALHFGPLRTFELAGSPWVAVFHGERLHLLDGNGRRHAVQSLADLGLGEEPTDMDIVAPREGPLQAWFFDDSRPRIVACELAREALRWERCRERMAGPQLKASERSRAVHLAADPARSLVYVADAHGGSVRAFDTGGKLVAQSPGGTLFFPNRVRVQGDLLAVADNDHRRLAWLDLAGDRPTLAVRRSLAAATHPQAGGTKVTDFAAAGDTLWMLAVRQGQKHGNVLVWQGDRPVARADLGEFQDPLWIDRFGTGALVADFDGVALQRVGARGELLGPFGAGDFADELVAARSALGWGQGLARAGWVWLAGSFVVGCVLAWRYGERPGAQAARAAFGELAAVEGESPAGEIILQPQPWYVRQLRGGLLLQLVVSAAMVALLGGLAATGPGFTATAFWPVLVAGCAALVIVPLAWFRVLSGGTLVVTADALEWRRGAQVIAHAPIAEVWASPSALLVGRTAILYREPEQLSRQGRWIYEEASLRRYVLARVPAAQRVAPGELMKRQIGQLALPVRILLGALAIGAIALQLWLTFR